MSAERNARAGAAGFTLIEMLVAVTLVAFIAVLLSGGLRLATRGGATVDRRLAASREVELAYDFMANQLAGAQPLPASNDAPDAPVEFTGDADSVAFVALLPPDLGLGGYYRLHAWLADDGNAARRLIVSWDPRPQAGADPPAAASGPPSVLIDDARSVAFAYYGVTSPNTPAGWSDRWTDQRVLPQLVRLRLVLADGTQAPDLIVAPRLAGPVSQ